MRLRSSTRICGTYMNRCSLCDYHTVRYIPSTGDHYTVQALPFTGEPWLFRYIFLEDTP